MGLSGTGQLLPFISDADFYKHTGAVVGAFASRVQRADGDLYKNVIDPFSALFNCCIQGIAPSSWLESEKVRQVQKTFEDSLGHFHQNVLASMPGWKKIGLTDIASENLGIVAEVKNKYNTTKGADKVRIYDDLLNTIGHRDYWSCIGYYVEVIPRSPRLYDEPFTPSDNRTHSRRGRNDRIRRIDGNSFYAKASGYERALRMLYEALPKVISGMLGGRDIAWGRELVGIFDKAYGESESELI